jgi:hypothetical protein
VNLWDFSWIFAITAFFGTSENAVKTLVWIAISVYVLVAIIKKQLNLDLSLYTILQILSITVLEKTPITQSLAGSNSQNEMIELDKQLMLFNLINRTVVINLKS